MKAKKMIALVLTVFTMLSFFSFNVFAEDVNIGVKQAEIEENVEAALQSQGATVNIDDWNYTNDNGIVTLTEYEGTSTDVVIPANQDFDGDTKKVHISAEVMKSIVADKKATSIIVSNNGNPVVADGTDWSYVFYLKQARIPPPL